MGVAPNFGIEGTATRIENAHDLPACATEPNGVSQSQARIGRLGVFTDDEFGQTRPEHTALDDFDVAANGKDVRRDTTKFNVGVGAGGKQRNRRHQDSLRGQQRAVGPASDALSILDNFDRIERDCTGHFGCGPRAGNERVVRGAGRNKRGLESACERQHGNEDTHGSGNPHHCNDCGGPASFDAPDVVDEWNGHFRLSSAR